MTMTDLEAMLAATVVAVWVAAFAARWL